MDPFAAGILSFCGWWLLACLGMAFIEYVLHRWPMHNKRWVDRTGLGEEALESHAVLHHGRFFKDFEHDPDPAARYVSVELQPGYNVLGLSPIWLAVWLAFGNAAALAFVAVFALHGFAWTAMHKEMHTPRGRWFSRTRWYQYVRACHRTHHDYPGANFCAVFPPVMDLLFRTHRPPTNGGR